MSERSAKLGWVVWGLRLATVAMVLAGAVMGYRRLHRSPEQEELLRYVEMELPALRVQEAEVMKRLAPLSGGGLSPEAARTLLVDDLIPRLIKLRKQSASVEARTEDMRGLRGDYLTWIDQLIEACRTSVRAIDEPAGQPAEALRRVRERFAEADRAAERWGEHVRAACVRHRLAPPR